MVEVPPSVRLEIEDGIAHLILDAPGRSANVMDDAYGEAMENTVDRLGGLLAEPAGTVRGVVVRSTKRTFFAGGDVEAMVARPARPEAWRWRLEQVQQPLRALETCGVPVVAAINGAAVGGGLEIALAADHRVAVAGDYPLGLPEVSLGVLAAGGGISRTVRMLGLVTALESVLLSGRTYDPVAALALGLVDEVVADPADLLPVALAWLEQAIGDPDPARRPWDRAGFRLPEPTTGAADELRALERRTAFALPEAPRAAFRAASGGASLDFEDSARLEIEEFLQLATRPAFGVTLQAAFLDRRTVARARKAEIAATDETRSLDRLDSALRAEIANLEADGVDQGRITETCARLGLGGADLDDVELASLTAGEIDPEVADRLLFAVSLAAVAALADGTIGSVAEANVLSTDHLGFPAVLGGALGHVLSHVRDGIRTGLEGFLLRARELADAHGPRFELTAEQSILLAHLAEQESPS